MKRGYSIETFPATLHRKYGMFIDRSNIYVWFDKHPEFHDSRKAGDAYQQKFYERRLHDALKKGVKGWPSGAWVFTMKNKFRWRDNPHEEGQGDDRPTFADLMKSIEHDESNNTSKKKKPSKRSKK